jgi:hypothetical protein
MAISIKQASDSQAGSQITKIGLVEPLSACLGADRLVLLQELATVSHWTLKSGIRLLKFR